MYKNYQFIVNTAAGRRRYMQYLVPMVIASDIVDRYDIWVNTNDLCDIEFFKELAKKYTKVNLVWQPDGVFAGTRSINAFYRSCCEENTIYLRLDDDVIWVEPDFFEKMARFRLEHPEYLVISPLVINNPKSSYILQVRGKLNLRKYSPSETFNDTFWKDGDFAYSLHTWFLGNYLRTNRYHELYCGEIPIGVTRFSINSICWFGSDLKQINGMVDGDEEEFMSCIFPTKFGKACCYYCDTIAVHFAFYTQREKLDQMNILGLYGQYMHDVWSSDAKLSEIDHAVQTIMRDVSIRSNQILGRAKIYREIRSGHLGKTKKFIKNWMPPKLFALIREGNHKNSIVDEKD